MAFKIEIKGVILKRVKRGGKEREKERNRVRVIEENYPNLYVKVPGLDT